MVNNSTNINKTIKHLSLSLAEHKKPPTTYDVWNPGPGLGQAHFVEVVNRLMGLVFLFKLIGGEKETTIEK